MALTVCWAAKGGSGTTVVAASMALSSPRPTLLVDLAGDAPAAIGLADSGGQGVADWLDSHALPATVLDLALHVDETTSVVPRGNRLGDRDAMRWAELADWLAAWPGEVIVDAGTGLPPLPLVDVGRGLLVTRACYLGLRRMSTAPVRPDGIVLVAEPGRTLRAADIERCVGAPIVATLAVDPVVAKAVDSGLLASRLPRSFRGELRGAA